MRKQNPKANHVVWAYRHYNEHFQIVQNLSDDGEPKNSSAPPILSVMQGEELIDCGILVVRYFGGVKLGIGGLVRAYKNAAQAVIENAHLIKHTFKVHISCDVAYSDFSKFEYIVNEYGAAFINRDFGAAAVGCGIEIEQSHKEAFVEAIKRLGQNIAVSDIKL